MECFVSGKRILVLSTLTVQELAAAPAEVRRRLASVPEAHIETLQLDAEARELAEAYVAAGVLTAMKKSSPQFEVAGGSFEYHWYEHPGIGRFEVKEVRLNQP